MKIYYNSKIAKLFTFIDATKQLCYLEPYLPNVIVYH